jgi:hypothetical protein
VFTGNQLVVVIGIIVAAMILYFALVFGRAAVLKAEIAKERQKIEMQLGQGVRR